MIWPWSPKIRSAPLPPKTVSLAVPPRMLSMPAPPLIESMLPSFGSVVVMKSMSPSVSSILP